MDRAVGPPCLDNYAEATTRRTDTLEPKIDNVPSTRCETPNRSDGSCQLIEHLRIGFADFGITTLTDEIRRHDF